jgi:hypothetical protein
LSAALLIGLGAPLNARSGSVVDIDPWQRKAPGMIVVG